MALRPEDLPSDSGALVEMVLAYAGKIDSLEETIATLKTLIFGARSERAAVVCAEQLALNLEAESASPLSPANDDAPMQAPAARRRKPRRNIGALPAHLPRCEQVIEPASTLCPCCAGQMHRFGEDVAEALDRVPARLRVLRTIRPKYACRGCEGSVVQAATPARLVEGGMATTALIANIATASTLGSRHSIVRGRFWRVMASPSTGRRWRVGCRAQPGSPRVFTISN